LLAIEGIDVNAKKEDGWTPLHLAVIHGHLDIVKVLLAMEVLMSMQRKRMVQTPLHLAASHGHLEIVKALLAMESVDVNA
jgi:ankyrin repeat protein